MTRTAQAQTVADTIDQHRMLSVGEPVVVGFSGGADSTALAVLLVQLGHNVILGHVDHSMRPESAGEAEWCAHIAERLGTRFMYDKVKVSPPTQAEARRVRYLCLVRMAEQCGAFRIATGHTLDDQAETVRMRLDRGGFGMGIPAVRENVVRPLLGLRRSDTEQVCRSAEIPYLTDPSNQNPKYTRVRIRSELQHGSQDEVLRLVATGREASAQADIARSQAVAHVEKWVKFENSDAVIDRTALRSIEPQQARQLIRTVAGHLGLDPNPRLLTDILSKVIEVTGARLTVGLGLSVWCEKEVVVIGRWTTPAVLPQIRIEIPGVTNLYGWGLQLSAESADVREVFSPSKLEELIDADQLADFASIRQWRPGDRFCPLGSSGSSKLQDFFVDTGVPQRLRSRVPILECGGRIAWVAGHRLDDRFKVTGSTKSVLRIRIEQTSQLRREVG